jgi:phospholipid-transporting ATPase
VDEYAQEGLRTLFLAEKFIDEETYSSWLKESNAAKLEINNREEKVAAVDEKIEIELELIGSTAIEDRLQDEVADTIQFMKKTGIKVWVLTGDKIETAINIGVSAGLLDSNMAQHLVDEENIPDLYKSLTLINKMIRESEKGTRQAIIVAGHSLVSIDSDDNVRELFLKASDQVDVVLACRVSPK